ncbi:MAG: phosphatidylglycerophosphatase A [Desulfobacteraceae bacterium]|nr:phosphatidylglycerophosphatase A [Desulfobacteraceae bacterium]
MERTDRRSSLGLRVATLLGIGWAPVAPGTVATIVAGVPCFLLVGHLSWPAQTAFALFVYALGWVATDAAERELGKSDPSEAVIDELCGFLVSMLGHPVTFPSILAGIVFFRLFDIWKPWPLRWLDRNIHGGFGAMLDDLGAGIYANVAGLIVLRLAGVI